MRKTFYENFKENMDLLGAPCPMSLYTSVAATIGTTKALLDLVAKFGTRVTLLEVIKAGGTASRAGALSAAGLAELSAVAAGMLASLYIGAVLGSLLVAVDRTYGGEFYPEDRHLEELYYRVGQVLDGSMPQWLKDLFALHQAGMSRPSEFERNKAGSHHLRNVLV